MSYVSGKTNSLLLGSDLKLLINASLEDVSMNIVDFDVTFKIGKKSLVLNKKELIAVDDNNYIACISSDNTEVGALIIEIDFKIPDEDFPKKVFVQKERITTDIVISK